MSSIVKLEMDIEIQSEVPRKELACLGLWALPWAQGPSEGRVAANNTIKLGSC